MQQNKLSGQTIKKPKSRVTKQPIDKTVPTLQSKQQPCIGYQDKNSITIDMKLCIISQKGHHRKAMEQLTSKQIAHT
jgi:hypothetical protein